MLLVYSEFRSPGAIDARLFLNATETVQLSKSEQDIEYRGRYKKRRGAMLN